MFRHRSYPQRHLPHSGWRWRLDPPLLVRPCHDSLSQLYLKMNVGHARRLPRPLPFKGAVRRRQKGTPAARVSTGRLEQADARAAPATATATAATRMWWVAIWASPCGPPQPHFARAPISGGGTARHRDGAAVGGTGQAAPRERGSLVDARGSPVPPSRAKPGKGTLREPPHHGPPPPTFPPQPRHRQTVRPHARAATTSSPDHPRGADQAGGGCPARQAHRRLHSPVPVPSNCG